MPEGHRFLETLALVLCAAGVTTVLFQRLKQPVVLGYLLAGMVIGPYIPIPFVADSQVVHTLAELGVILLMFSLGIEFSLAKLLRVGPTAAFIAVVQCSFMLWLGYMVGQTFGWSRLASMYAGAVISISSTTIIIKAFQEQQIKGGFAHIVFGVLIVEDLIAILLITILTALSVGDQLGPLEVARTAGRLTMFLVLLIVIGLFTVPPLMRFVVKLDRSEITVVTSVGLAFGLSYLAAALGYSVALGAFIAGSLVAESGVEKTVEHHVQGVRDIFAAIFFVSVGMLIDPAAIAAHWGVVLVFLVVVVIGKVGSVTLSALLTGRSVQTSVKTGMSMAQIGEFSFIIAGVGISTRATDGLLYSIAVAVSGITTLMTPWLIRAAQPTAALVDRKLPRALQTFLGVYGAWLDRLRSSGDKKSPDMRIRQRVGWLIVDGVVVALVVIGASVEADRLRALVQARLDVSEQVATLLIVAGAAALSAPFWIGMIRVARTVGFEVANRVFPRDANSAAVDLSAAPRRLLVVTLQMAAVILLGLPLVAITQPFLPPWQGAILLLGLLALLAVSFWRGATSFQGHARAAGQAIFESLKHQTKEGKAAGVNQTMEAPARIFEGLGSPVAVQLPTESRAVGRTLAEINLRGLTGATVIAIQRGDSAISVPSGHERLLPGDVLALAGTEDSITAAKEVLTVNG